MDTVDEDLPRWLRFYLDNGGDPKQITVSTDASITSPRTCMSKSAPASWNTIFRLNKRSH
jgi:hypothetical protein